MSNKKKILCKLDLIIIAVEKLEEELLMDAFISLEILEVKGLIEEEYEKKSIAGSD